MSAPRWLQKLLCSEGHTWQHMETNKYFDHCIICGARRNHREADDAA